MHDTPIIHAGIIPLIGGFSLAATNVTDTPPSKIFSYKAFYENDKLYLRYLKKKGFDVPYIVLDEEEKYSGSEAIDVVHGVPPCAGLSMCSALKKGVRATAPTNDWMYRAAEFVMGQVKPRAYIFENAPTLFTGVGEPIRDNLKAIAESHGYAGTFYKTDTLLHGVPQRRPRTYTVLVQGDKAPMLNYFNRPAPGIEEYLKQIPKEATLQDAYTTKEPNIEGYEIVRFLRAKFGEDWRQEFYSVRDHLTSYDFLNRKGLLKEFKDYVAGLNDAHPSTVKDIDHVIKKLAMGKNFRLSHRVLCVDRNHVYAVIGEMMERNVHPIEPRRLNIREYMHLMGLPHDFDLSDPKEFSKITQNVPVPTSESIFGEVVEYLKGNRETVCDRWHYQNNEVQYKEVEKKRSKSLF